MTARRMLAVFLAVDVACAVACLAVLALGGPSPFRVVALLVAVSSALCAAAGLAQSRGRSGGRR